MSLPTAAVLAYTVTVVTAVAAAFLHADADAPVHRSEQQFVRAVSALSEAAMSAVSWPSHDLDPPRPAR